MSFGGVLEVVIGLAFVYLVLSLVASGVTEGISAALQLRSKQLESAIVKMLEDERGDGEDALATKFFALPIVKALSTKTLRGNTRKPSYIPSRTFSLALLSLVLPSEAFAPKDGATDPADVRASIDTALQSDTSPVTVALRTLWEGAEKDVDKFRTAVEQWFDDVMDRVSGWYTRWAKVILVVVGLVLAVMLNVDSFVVGNQLWKDPSLRQATNAAAKTVATGASNSSTTPTDCAALSTTTTTAAGTTAPGTSPQEVAKGISCLDELQLPIGWTTTKGDPRNFPAGWDVLGRLLGWLITGLALSLGAPFWFNALNELLGLRSSGSVPPTSDAAKKQSSSS